MASHTLMCEIQHRKELFSRGLKPRGIIVFYEFLL